MVEREWTIELENIARPAPGLSMRAIVVRDLGSKFMVKYGTSMIRYLRDFPGTFMA